MPVFRKMHHGRSGIVIHERASEFVQYHEGNFSLLSSALMDVPLSGGRKNDLFSGSQDAAQCSAICCSLPAKCQAGYPSQGHRICCAECPQIPSLESANRCSILPGVAHREGFGRSLAIGGCPGAYGRRNHLPIAKLHACAKDKYTLCPADLDRLHYLLKILFLSCL